MRYIFTFVLVALGLCLHAQIKPELTPAGFSPVEIPRPSMPNEKLIDLAKAWAPFYNKDGYDVYDVTPTSVTIDGIKNNAFYYRNLGEVFQHRIKYTLKAEFSATTCTMTLTVGDIYANSNVTTMTVSDFFTPDGRLKEDYEEVRPSLEKTAQNILRSFAAFINE